MGYKEYYKESINQILDECTSRDEIVDAIIHSIELESEANGYNFITNPENTEIYKLRKEIEKLKLEINLVNNRFYDYFKNKYDAKYIEIDIDHKNNVINNITAYRR